MPPQEDIEAQQVLLAAHPLTLAIFSGLPGTGKTTLARLVAAHLHLPLVPLDDIVDIIPPHMGAHAQPFWEDMMHIVLGVAKIHLTHNRWRSFVAALANVLGGHIIKAIHLGATGR
jgi:hypothetical protein